MHYSYGHTSFKPYEMVLDRPVADGNLQQLYNLKDTFQWYLGISALWFQEFEAGPFARFAWYSFTLFVKVN